MSKDTQPIRELFIEELEQVSGGGPVDELIRKVTDDNKIMYWLREQLVTTMACGEESPC